MDACARRGIWACLCRAIEEKTVNIFIVATHRLDELAPSCKRVALLHHGRIALVGSANQLSKRLVATSSDRTSCSLPRASDSARYFTESIDDAIGRHTGRLDDELAKSANQRQLSQVTTGTLTSVLFLSFGFRCFILIRSVCNNQGWVIPETFLPLRCTGCKGDIYKTGKILAIPGRTNASPREKGKVMGRPCFLWAKKCLPPEKRQKMGRHCFLMFPFDQTGAKEANTLIQRCESLSRASEIFPI